MFAGNYDEFRIYDTALNPVEVAASYVKGVAQPSTDPASLGTLQAVTLTVAKTTMTELDTRTVFGRPTSPTSPVSPSPACRARPLSRTSPRWFRWMPPGS